MNWNATYHKPVVGGGAWEHRSREAASVCMITLLEVTAHPHLFSNPLPPERAMAYFEARLAQPFTEAIWPGDSYWSVLLQLDSDDGHARNSHIRCSCRQPGNRAWRDSLFRGPRIQALPGAHHVNSRESERTHFGVVARALAVMPVRVIQPTNDYSSFRRRGATCPGCASGSRRD